MKHYLKKFFFIIFLIAISTQILSAQSIIIEGYTSSENIEDYPFFVLGNHEVFIKSSYGGFNYVCIDDVFITMTSATWTKYTLDVTKYNDNKTHKLQLNSGKINYGTCYFSINPNLAVNINELTYAIEDDNAIVTGALYPAIVEAIIPESYTIEGNTYPVVSIANNAFEEMNNLQKVVIPNSVTSIKNNAFAGCKALSSVNIANSVKTIGSSAFSGCLKLKSLKIPFGVTKIGAHAFSGNTLEDIYIPSSLISIGEYAFGTSYNYGNYEEFEDSNVKVYITDLQAWCKIEFKDSWSNPFNNGGRLILNNEEITDLIIPEKISKIMDYAFWGCSGLTSITIPGNVLSIGNESFGHCNNLIDINLSPNLTKIGESVFIDCWSLSTITIPKSVKEIWVGAFERCYSLKYLSFEDGEDPIKLCYYSNDNDAVSFTDSPIKYIYLGRNLDYPTSSKYGFSPFYKNNKIKTIDIGKYVTNAQSIYPSQNEETLTEINCYNPFPPEMRNFSYYQYNTIKVNIPVGSLEEFQNDKIWGNFIYLKETLPSVESSAKEIVLNVKNAVINIGETLQIEATVLPEDNTDKSLLWSSSDSNIASVSYEGFVTAVSAGKAIITATCGEVSAECVVTVLEDAGVESLLANPDSKISIYSTEGILIKKDCSVEDLKTLNKGIYIIVSGKERYKIAI